MKEEKLKEHTAHVWCADLNKSESEIARLLSLLSADEKYRASRFVFDKDRNLFIAARGVLREILSHYLSIAPQEIMFSYTEYGKPSIDPQYNLQFNVSHSHNLALYAVTREESVGVDVEYTDRKFDLDGIVERYFSSNEIQVIRNLNGAEKNQAFFNGWVRKEAFLKALGAGLSYSLSKVEVSLTNDQPARILALHDEQLNINDWHLRAMEPMANYTAALVVKGTLKNIEINFWK